MEEIALAIQMDAERLGAVAFHHAKPRDACVSLPNKLLHRYWLNGWDAASHGKQRYGVLTALVDGVRRAGGGGDHPMVPVHGLLGL